MSNETNPYSKTLDDSAPGLKSSLKSILTAEELSDFETLYSICASRGALYEGPVRRGESEAFNPRPARVCKILLRESKEHSAITFMAALIACCKDLPNSSELSTRMQVSALELAQGSSNTAQQIQLALYLDELRHLHMTNHSEPDQIQLCKDVYERIKNFAISEKTERLMEVVKSTLRRNFIRLDSDELLVALES